MSKRFSTLIWLGAGNAAEPHGLIESAAEAILVEHRDMACAELRKKFPSVNISVRQHLLNTDAKTVEFTSYNLPELSAINSPTGLKQIFPGLKAVTSEYVSSTSVTDFIKSLKLKDCNNLLVVDIADINLALVNSLHDSDLLSYFNEIHLQAGVNELYTNAATVADICAFLTKNGYIQEQITPIDPDLPWLKFVLNPLWQTLKVAQASEVKLTAEINSLKEALLNKELELSKPAQNIDKLEPAISDGTLTEKNQQKIAQLEAISLKQEEAIEELQISMINMEKQLALRLERIGQLEKINRVLHETNSHLEIQQEALTRELLKLETQIDAIRQLLINQ